MIINSLKPFRVYGSIQIRESLQREEVKEVRNTPRGKTTMLNILKENHSYRMKRTSTESEREHEFNQYKEMKVSIEKYFKE